MKGPLPRVFIAGMVLTILSACGGGDDVLSGGCDLGICAGTYEHGSFQAEISGETIAIDDFFARCFGVYPDGRHCNMTITGFDPPEVVTIGRDCQFTLRAQEGLIELTIDGSVDTESCSASGTYGFQYGSCCSSNGSWYAGRI